MCTDLLYVIHIFSQLLFSDITWKVGTGRGGSIYTIKMGKLYMSGPSPLAIEYLPALLWCKPGLVPERGIDIFPPSYMHWRREAWFTSKNLNLTPEECRVQCLQTKRTPATIKFVCISVSLRKSGLILVLWVTLQKTWKGSFGYQVLFITQYSYNHYYNGTAIII